ncbi:uncharacterized protein I303_105257 [Kwoniella dejecticola CBS 10117]|uniref:DUF6534 domain-containing protein n=1 Tax=Kwoniella dejecticola CBS 10117 TaxID=1296121 RepID=A0A1A6A300_9TREE|nr:uncharacterized protein I303_05295 [Kwoniella dejecticola CBS 10117]OBR84437.1 hypothetical protein I303_05295 [Kwoniella dejecticola CBS 10117]
MSVIDIKGMPVEQVETIAQMAFGGDVGWHIGPFLLSVVFDSVLFGVVSQQYMTWWTYSRPTERRIYVYVTHFLAIAAVAYTACEISYAMHNFVYNFGNFRVFLEVKYPQIFPIMGWITSAPIQFFYTERSFRLNGNNWFLAILLAALIFGTFGMTIWILAFCQTLSSELQALLIVRQVQAWQCLTLATDGIITLSIAWGLYKSRTGWSNTDALVKRLLIITLETQLGPTILMLAFVTEFAISPPLTLGIFFEQLIPKFYLVGFLATLNSRYTLRRDSQPGLSVQCSPRSNTRGNAYLLGSGQLQQATVNVETETYVESFHMQKSQIGINRLPLEDEPSTVAAELSEKLDLSKNDSTHTLQELANIV